MQPLRVFSVIPKLPKKLEPLWDLAHNFWFAWNNQIAELFAQVDHRLWRESNMNPVWFLNRVPQRTLEQLAADEAYLSRLREMHAALEDYRYRKYSHASFQDVSPDRPAVAYFSLEYGVCLSLPVYSGGLGMLAGDHLKSASDLAVPLVGVGLLYRQGYFRQYLTPDGWQQERYPDNDFEQMSVAPLRAESGDPLTVSVDLAGRTLNARVWKAAVGRVDLYLLDANILDNPPELRQVTARLYGGDLEMRLWQEILLGIGGIKALRALGLEPRVIHMNEGHSAFAGLERIRRFMAEHGLSFEAAQELTASSSVFTTHTPVPAGNDRFPPDLMQRYFEQYARDLGLAWKVFLALGREDPRDDSEQFCMTVLALRLSRFSNGVSKLHGRVSRSMWKRIWPRYPVDDVPIGSVTNGVHVASWIAPDMAMLFDRYLGSNWREDPDSGRVWSQAETIAEAELWRVHERLRARLVDFTRRRLRAQLQARGARVSEIEAASEVLDPEALTIGFARRFATYKRAYLLLRDAERLDALMHDPARPVQFIFAGKAHPQDNEGKKIIQELSSLCRSAKHRFQMVFLEDYDMEIASYMVQGCDVWLNNPRRPLEACGTSGMKAMFNGVLQVSTLDGWWDEACKPDSSVGWGIGEGEEYDDHEYQDFVESQTLYNVLENSVVPEFYDRGRSGLPRAWIGRMKQALSELGARFNSHRMVEEYVADAYLPVCRNYEELVRDGFQRAKELAAWRSDMMTGWDGLRIRNVSAANGRTLYVGDRVEVRAEVLLGSIAPRHVKVEVYSGPLDNEGAFAGRSATAMEPVGEPVDGWQAFLGLAEPQEAGRFGFTVRIVPSHPHLLDPHALGLIRWASEG